MNAAQKQTHAAPCVPTLIELESVSGIYNPQWSETTVRLKIDGRSQVFSDVGDGPIDALFKALAPIDPMVTFGTYQLLARENSSMPGAVRLELTRGACHFEGCGEHKNSIAASAQAFVSALNKIKMVEASGLYALEDGLWVAMIGGGGKGRKKRIVAVQIVEIGQQYRARVIRSCTKSEKSAVEKKLYAEKTLRSFKFVQDDGRSCTLVAHRKKA